MAYTALYREWRPSSFQEVVGQKQVTVTLKNQIKNNRIAHAYLLCGTRGTGKTTVAKILSKTVNCINPVDGEPCNKCKMCIKIDAGASMDVIEMDAASHRGIDKMRDIIEDVQYPPTEGNYKVYIIDEVHMLTVEAVNAFLKTLEEPPKNVIFILATTDPQKLPITILSRCQRFNFSRIKNDEIFNRLREIVDIQGTYADDNSLQLISRMSDGALRDALSILDQAISMGDGKVQYNQVVEMLGLVSNEYLLELGDAIIEKKVEESMKLIEDIIFKGKDVYALIKEMSIHMRNLMMVKVSNNPEEIIDMSTENLQLLKIQSEKITVEEVMRALRVLQEAEEQSKWSKQSRIYLELAVIRMCKAEYDTSKEVLLARINKLERLIMQGAVISAPEKEVKKSQKQSNKEVKEIKEVDETEEENQDSNLNLEKVKSLWRDALDLLKARRMMSINAHLKNGAPINCTKGVIEVSFPKEYSFSKKQLDNEEEKQKIQLVLSEVFREKVRIKFTVEQKEETEEINKEQRLIDTFGEDLLEIIDQ